MPASIRSRVGILHEVLADLSGPIGDRVGRKHPESSIVARPGRRLRENLRYVGGHEGSEGRNRSRFQGWIVV